MKKIVFISFIYFLFTITHAKGARPFTEDQLVQEIEKLENATSSFSRDSLLVLYYNDLIERYNWSGKTTERDAYLAKLETCISTSLWPVSRAFLVRAKARIQDRNGDYTNAIENYHETIRIMEKNKYGGEELGYSYVLLAFNVLNNGNQREAWKLMEKSMEHSKTAKDKSVLIWALDFFGDNSLFNAKNLEDYKKALGYYLEVEKYLPESLVENQKGNSLLSLSQLYLKLDNQEKAKEYFEKCLAQENKKNNPNYMNLHHLYLGWAEYYLEKAEYKNARAYAESSLEYARKFGFAEFVNRSLKILYQTEKEGGNFQQALLYLEEFRLLEDSLSRDEVKKKYVELDKRFNFEKQQNEIKTLENNNLRLGILLLFLLLLSGVIILYWFKKNRQKVQELNKALQHRNLEVESALAEGKELERKKISERLHDTIATKISSLKWKIEAEEKNINPLLYQNLVMRLENLYEDVRSLSHEKGPLEFLEKGFKTATEEVFWNISKNMEAHFEVQIDETCNSLEKRIQFLLYQCTLELCTNLVKHSKPSFVQFLASKYNDHIQISLENDGIFGSTIKMGQGLKNIQSKVKTAGGTVEVIPTPSFKVSIAIPLA